MGAVVAAGNSIVSAGVTAGARQVSFQLDYLLDHPDYQPSQEVMNGAVAHAERGALRGRVIAIVGLVLGFLGVVGVIGAGNVISAALIAIGLVAAAYCYFSREAASALRAIQAKQMESAPTKVPTQLPSKPEA